MLRSCLKSFRVSMPALTMLALLTTATPAFSAERHAETQPATTNGSGAPLAKIPQTNAIGAAPATVKPPSDSQGTAPGADQDDFSPAQADNLFSPGYQACMDRAAGVTTDMQDCIAAELERLDKIIADRVGNKGVGFNSEIAGPTSVDENDLLRQVLPQDLNAFGMIPEFVGRTPVVTQTQALDEDDLVSILTEPKNAVVRQYRKMFQLEDVELEFEDAALHEIARMALARKTGARGLRSICEDVLQQTMFDLPSEEGVSKVIVTEASVKGEEQPQRIYG